MNYVLVFVRRLLNVGGNVVPHACTNGQLCGLFELHRINVLSVNLKHDASGENGPNDFLVSLLSIGSTIANVMMSMAADRKVVDLYLSEVVTRDHVAATFQYFND